MPFAMRPTFGYQFSYCPKDDGLFILQLERQLQMFQFYDVLEPTRPRQPPDESEILFFVRGDNKIYKGVFYEGRGEVCSSRHARIWIPFLYVEKWAVVSLRRFYKKYPNMKLD